MAVSVYRPPGLRYQTVMFTVSRRRLLTGAAGFVLAQVLPVGLALAREAVLTPLVIETASGGHRFAVEVVADDESRARGLMFRRELAPDRGMLFDYGTTMSDVAMWMKNTYIPLDMLFIRADGSIRTIAERTVPHSLVSIAAGGPVRAVLEVNGGTAERLGIAPGDRVRHAIFGNPP